MGGPPGMYFSLNIHLVTNTRVGNSFQQLCSQNRVYFTVLERRLSNNNPFFRPIIFLGPRIGIIIPVGGGAISISIIGIQNGTPLFHCAHSICADLAACLSKVLVLFLQACAVHFFFTPYRPCQPVCIPWNMSRKCWDAPVKKSSTTSSWISWVSTLSWAKIGVFMTCCRDAPWCCSGWIF